MPRGRPKLQVGGGDLPKLRRMASLGLTRAMMASVIGISEKTLERRLQENETLCAAIREGEAEACSAVAQTALNMATSGKHPALTIFYLKTRLGWRERESQIDVLNAELKALQLVEILRQAGIDASEIEVRSKSRGLLENIPSSVLTDYIKGRISAEEFQDFIKTSNSDGL